MTPVSSDLSETYRRDPLFGDEDTT